jgi:hypothetical protein
MDNFSNLYFSLLDYWQSPEGARLFLWVKVVSLAISTLLIFAILILLLRSRAVWWIGERLDSFKKVKLPERIQRDWEKIQARLEKDDEASLKLAVIEADNLLDEILKRMGLPGKDMGERLEQMSREQLKSLDDIWDAHRLRNLIVHKSDVVILKSQGKKAVEAYEKGLRELEVI